MAATAQHGTAYLERLASVLTERGLRARLTQRIGVSEDADFAAARIARVLAPHD